MAGHQFGVKHALAVLLGALDLGDPVLDLSADVAGEAGCTEGVRAAAAGMVHVRRWHVVKADLADRGLTTRVFTSGKGRSRRCRRGGGAGALNYGKSSRRLRNFIGGHIKLWRVRGRLCRSSRHGGGGNNHLLELEFRGVVLVG
uniref:Uncharacterized protein n=1 Tax=Arundo donax TaxID=35708 RepID=A0A0A9E8U1_ARUDO